ncbi:protein of unknown function DUF187 [Crinalium epipsammum PCC 9333]|uniref:Glycosyl hydrolase-like 10 domain-containing protein n=1 Tax=Crinalium epipsammum PCC 9333 TaxID=1173022 RepID=K9VW17_9CYAN|nr:protein of unknown function DUF187 [Crinalium epipsammum PCC 9333]
MLKQAKNYILKFCAKRLVFLRYNGKFKNNFVWLCALLLAIAVIIPTSSSAQTNLNNTSELRGVWLTNVDSDVLFSRAKLTAAVQKLQQLNFNTVYPTVWNDGYTLYPSIVAERTLGRSLHPEPGLQGRDMLKEIVKQGHQKGLSVIPWFEFGFMAPADSQLAKSHPDWLTNRKDGTKIWKEGQNERVWLNPFHPEVQQFMLDLVSEVINNYDIDGIQFDDHFALPIAMGYDAYTVGMYEKELPGLTPDANPQETFWVRWRADKLNDFMTRLHQVVKARKPNCIISIATNPLHFSLPAYLQDWFSWERRNQVDELILQVYRNDLPRFIKELEREEVKLAQSHIPVSIGILAGLKGRSVPSQQIETQVQVVRNHKLAGVSFFFYESLWNWAKETPAQRESALKEIFPTSVQRPRIINN